MPKLIILGTSFAIPSTGHDNTHMVLVGDERTVMIDCVNNPVERLNGAKLEPNDVTDILCPICIQTMSPECLLC